jgi:uncharacterized Zn finger protein (UPF0148 family)
LRGFGLTNCPRCGKPAEELDVFCTNCGSRIVAETAPVAPAPASPDDQIRDVITRRLDGIKNRDERTVRSIIDASKYSKFDDWPPFTRQIGETGLSNEFGAFQVLSSYNYDIANLKIDIIGDTTIATFYFHYTGEMRNQPFDVNSRVTIILLKENEEWKIIHEHYSRMSDVEPSPASRQQMRRGRHRWP